MHFDRLDFMYIFPVALAGWVFYCTVIATRKRSRRGY